METLLKEFKEFCKENELQENKSAYLLGLVTKYLNSANIRYLNNTETPPNSTKL